MRPVSGLTEFGKHFSVKFGSNPESSNLDKFVQHWLRPINGARPFRFCHHSQEPGNCHTGRGCYAPGAPFDKQEVGLSLKRNSDRFSLSRIQIPAKFLNAPPIDCRDNYQPGSEEKSIVGGKSTFSAVNSLLTAAEMSTWR